MMHLQALKFCSVRLTKNSLPRLSGLFPSLSVRMNCISDDSKEKVIITPGNGEEQSSKTTPQHHLSYVDKLTLRYFGNVKGEIPNEVSFATMEMAESKRRILTNLFLVAFCAFGSMFVVYNVKKNLEQEKGQNINVQNSKRYQQDNKKS